MTARKIIVGVWIIFLSTAVAFLASTVIHGMIFPFPGPLLGFTNPLSQSAIFIFITVILFWLIERKWQPNVQITATQSLRLAASLKPLPLFFCLALALPVMVTAGWHVVQPLEDFLEVLIWLGFGCFLIFCLWVMRASFKGQPPTPAS